MDVTSAWNDHRMSQDGGPDLEAAVLAAYDLVGSEPQAALAAADLVIAATPRRGATAEQRATESFAQRVAALALMDVPDLRGAETRIRSALRIARACGSEERTAQAELTYGFVLLGRGRFEASLSALDRALPGLTGSDVGRCVVQRALVLQTMGRDSDALAAYTDGLEVLRAHDDRMMLGIAHHNRATLLAYRGELDAAIEDQERAADLHDELGRERFGWQARSDLAWLIGMSGRVPDALRLWDDLEAAVPADDPIMWLDRADILARAGLAHEAVASASRAVGWLDAQRTGWETMAAEADLGLAQALLRSGELDEAERHAVAARAKFRAQRRGSWLVVADYVRDTAQLLRDSDPRPRHLRSVSALEASGWRVLGLDLRVTVATRAIARGRTALAREAVAAPAVGPRDPLEVRSRGFHLQALARRLDGDERGAARSLRSAWDLVDRQRALVGASELRASAARQVADVVQEGLRSALADGSATQVLAWAERGRAASLRFPPALPPDDAALAASLAQLRMAARSRDESLLADRGGWSGAAELARLEQDVVRLTRQASGSDGDPLVHTARLRESLAEDGGRVLLELVPVDDQLLAVVLDRRGPRVVTLGPSARVLRAVDRAEFVLRRMASGFGRTPTSALDSALAELDRLLVAPLPMLSGASEVVISPSGALWRVPWSSLPSLARQVVVVTPSATVWHRARSRAATRTAVLTVAGPSLEHAESEAVAVAALHADARTITAGDASVARVSRELADADLAHLAVHGSLRRDNPLFSSLELADGPLMAYDLERLPRVPRTVVLPACHSGEGTPLPGEEMLGLAWTLLAAGSSTVVAAITAVPDGATADLMTRVHERLAAGDTAAAALHMARTSSDAGDAFAVATAAAFVCIGS
jgi:tetratricopeptide (TPR) repeat protein